MTSIRPMRVSDLSNFLTTNLDPLTETYGLNFYLEYLVQWPELCWVLVSHNEKIEGYILGKVESSPNPYIQPSQLPYDPATNTNDQYLPWHAHITALTIAPAARRLGHAKKLTQILEQKGDEQEAWFMDLYVRVENEIAIALYKSMGYSVYRRISNYYNNDSDAFDMRKPLARDTKRLTIRENGENHIEDPENVWLAISKAIDPYEKEMMKRARRMYYAKPNVGRRHSTKKNKQPEMKMHDSVDLDPTQQSDLTRTDLQNLQRSTFNAPSMEKIAQSCSCPQDKTFEDTARVSGQNENENRVLKADENGRARQMISQKTCSSEKSISSLKCLNPEIKTGLSCENFILRQENSIRKIHALPGPSKIVNTNEKAANHEHDAKVWVAQLALQDEIWYHEAVKLSVRIVRRLRRQARVSLASATASRQLCSTATIGSPPSQKVRTPSGQTNSVYELHSEPLKSCGIPSGRAIFQGPASMQLSENACCGDEIEGNVKVPQKKHKDAIRYSEAREDGAHSAVYLVPNTPEACGEGYDYGGKSWLLRGSQPSCSRHDPPFVALDHHFEDPKLLFEHEQLRYPRHRLVKSKSWERRYYLDPAR